MKKFTTLALVLAFAASLFGQNPAKKYLLIQHFTNSKCGICASKNPSFYSLIGTAANAANIHHIAIHPSVPYSDCVFYQANTAENGALQTQYNIQGTPRVALNGTLLPAASALTTQAQLDAEFSKTSPIQIAVAESPIAGTSDVKVDVTIKTVDANIPAGNYKLFVVAAEKVINQTTPNGEAVHHDVLRDVLPNTTGDAVTFAPVGQSVQFSYTYTVKSGWTAAQMFATAYVQDITSKAVLNSGTKFDQTVLSVPQLTENQALTIYPNPATTTTSLTLGNSGIVIETVDVFNAAGQKVLSITNSTAKATLDLSSLPQGLYRLQTKTANGTAIGKFIKL